MRGPGGTHGGVGVFGARRRGNAAAPEPALFDAMINSARRLSPTITRQRVRVV